jgi:hypothetical protein
MSERRRYPRLSFRRRIWCEGDRFTVSLQSVDVSAEGVHLRTSIPPPPGTRLQISLDEIALGDAPAEPSGRVVADAEVVWTRGDSAGGGMGLRIVSFIEGSDLWQRMLLALAGRSTSPP